ncbi:MAG: hypothetical protein ACI9BD_000018 [Candidatus Marinamargulisbacteria bacterium]|jgi:hypothetical protein
MRICQGVGLKQVGAGCLAQSRSVEIASRNSPSPLGSEQIRQELQCEKNRLYLHGALSADLILQEGLRKGCFTRNVSRAKFYAGSGQGKILLVRIPNQVEFNRFNVLQFNGQDHTRLPYIGTNPGFGIVGYLDTDDSASVRVVTEAFERFGTPEEGFRRHEAITVAMLASFLGAGAIARQSKTDKSE